MQPIFAQGNSRTLQRLKTLRQAAQTDKAPRVALRLQAIMLSVRERTTGQIAQALQVDRTRVHAWIGAWNEYGDEGLLEGQRSGRPAQLSGRQREQLADLLDSGPVAHGLNTGVWTSPLIAQILEEEFAVKLSPRARATFVEAVELFGAAAQDRAWCKPTPRNKTGGFATRIRI